MEDYKTPGQLIESLLEERGWNKRTLATVVGKGESTINKIIAGKQSIDAKIAILLEEVFGVDAERFLKIQRNYDLAIARVTTKSDPARSQRAHLYAGLPIAEMVKRGWLSTDDPHNVSDVERALKDFFQVHTLNDIEVLPHAARKTMVNTEPTPAQLAWLYRVKSIAEETLVPRYSADALRDALPKLKRMMCAPEEARNVPRALAECGVRFVIVETLPSAKIDGVCFWLNTTSPVIGITLRHDRIDNFWFVLRHEIEHVLQRHGMEQMILDTELEGERAGTGQDVPEEERIANEEAAEFCVPQAKLRAFIAGKAPLFSERDLLGFSKLLGVHAGIVAGQLQHKTGRYDRFRQHLVKIRNCISPNAATDGWGDIYPLGQ